MFNTIIRKLGMLSRRQLTLALCLLLGIALMLGLALAYTAHEKRADVGYSVSQETAVADVKEEATEAIIIQWMKDHSDMPEQVLSKIYNVAMNSVNADLVLAICLVESNFNPRVESEKGAIGLMGVMPDVWLDELKAHGIVRDQDDLYTISSNINSGLYVLGRYLSKTNNLKEALSRYAGGDPAYATRVLRRLREISLARHSEDQARLEALRTGG